MRRGNFLLSFLAPPCAVVAMAQTPPPVHNVRPAAGYVPDEETAIRIARAVWIPIYGEAAIARQAPYHAVLKDGVWTVTGSLPKGMLGGVALAEISKADGTVLRVSHGK